MVTDRKRIRTLYIWIMTGIIFSIVFGAMSASRGYNLKQLLNHGHVYDFSKASLELESKTCSYDEDAEIFTVLTDSAKKRFSKFPVRKWSYIEFEIDNLNADYSLWKLLYLDEDKDVAAEQDVYVVNGSNTVRVICDQKFKYVHIQILDQPGLQFSLKRVQLHTGKVVSFSDWLCQFLSYFMLYLLASIVWYVIRNRNIYAIVEIVQYIYIRIGDHAGSRVHRCLTENRKRHLRILLFMILFLGMIAANAAGIYDSDAGYRYCLVFVTLILMGIAFLLWEKPLKYVEWKGNVAFFWFLYWGFICVMDFLKDKHYRYTGYVCLFGVLLLVFVWEQSSKPECLWKEMICGLMATFPVVMLFCIIFRGKRVGVLYNGAFTDREDMALYSVVMLGIFLAVLATLCFREQRENRKKEVIRFFLTAVGVSLCVHNLYLTWTPMCLVAGGILLACFLIVLVVKREHMQKGLKKTMMWLIMAAVCSFIIVLPVHWCMNNFPQMLGLNVRLPHDILESYVPEKVMKLAEQTQPGLYKGVRCIAKAEKRLVWLSYIREIDLFGNDAMVHVAQHETMAQSGWLELIYRYGVIVLLPFIGMWAAILEKVIKKRNWRLGILFGGYHLIFLTQNIEKPFLQPLWILVYLGIGYLLSD